MTVRGYETDTQGHLNQSVYLQYTEHARWEYLKAAGIEQSDIVAKGVGPVTLEQTVRYKHELRAGDETTVSCAFEWVPGRKVFFLRQEVRKTDGTLAAEVTGTGGMMDLRARRLVADPRAALRDLASDPKVLGLE
ncbi:acyl-CoA thioesterase [Streptomyces sp. NBC_01795]|uniref:acyl-CoA thioesterase n=1 Tax=Streptomyces sp. NBC_01795 TaxID=2975943 RepID=UPI002DD9E19D|nr:acyl-CoA thioesterase [Streptomyces sp. NBC_01795]WSA97136.1 acyl-CoA thioesterase [Streptomyces sp. NBC_01795]